MQRMWIAAGLATLLSHYPFLAVFQRENLFLMGTPLIFVYVFILWGALIVFYRYLANKK